MADDNFRSSRRTLLLGTAGALAAPNLALAQSGEQLVVNAYGGEFQDIFLKTTVAPFEKKFGVKVVYDDAGSASEDYAKIRASRGVAGITRPRRGSPCRGRACHARRAASPPRRRPP
ncbi:MAG: hypothetical protein HC829_09025 [Bacteroidales bacterium]|nr:hypothetical protein [Bacteroidales bacterium]